MIVAHSPLYIVIQLQIFLCHQSYQIQQRRAHRGRTALSQLPFCPGLLKCKSMQQSYSHKMTVGRTKLPQGEKTLFCISHHFELFQYITSERMNESTLIGSDGKQSYLQLLLMKRNPSCSQFLTREEPGVKGTSTCNFFDAAVFSI